MAVLNKTILVVEDELPLLEAITVKLGLSGFATVTARTVEQALAYMEDIKGVKAIWLDHYLIGKENGLDFVSKIKEDGSAWKNIPIFVVSNTVGDDKKHAYLNLGANKFYTKSNFRLDQIIGDIKATLEQK